MTTAIYVRVSIAHSRSKIHFSEALVTCPTTASLGFGKNMPLRWRKLLPAAAMRK
jgi:hypothetical protein